MAVLTNPFYHAWKAGAIQSDSKILWINAKKENNYNPNIDCLSPETLKSTTIMYLCFPSNPQGALADINYLVKAAKLAKKYDFILAVDECYIDIYRTYLPKPFGLLDALVKMNSNLDNVIIFNSLSKRSSVPGLRAGFILGDENIISIYKLLVSNGASPVPIPIQNIAALLYEDEKHNFDICLHYDKNFKIAQDLLKETHPNLEIPKAGFYLWLPVKDDLKVAVELWKNYSVRVMPGTFMAENVSGENPCKGFLRIALVHKQDIVIEALQRISDYFKKIIMHDNEYITNLSLKKKLLFTIFGSIFFGISLFIILSSISFNFNDTGWLVLSNIENKNIFGTFGSYTSGFLLKEFGLLAPFCLALIFLIYGLKFLNKNPYQNYGSN